MAHSFDILRMATNPFASTAHRHRFAPRRNAKNRPSPSVCANGAMRKTAEERFHTLARGWLAYPVTPIHSQLPPKSGCRNVIPRFANLYNRSSAVDSLIHNQPQVGKPTWGYDYTTVLRRLPHPSKKNAHHHRFAPTAQCGKNRRRAVSYVSTGLA